MWDDDEDPEGFEPNGPGGMHWEEEPTIRSQVKFYYVPKMVKLSSTETIIGLLVNETDDYIELKWPCQMLTVPMSIGGVMMPMLHLVRYAPGIWEEFITLNKLQCVWWNDTEESVDKFYFNRVTSIYASAEQYMSKVAIPYPDVDDEEVESEVTKLTVGKNNWTLDEMLGNIKGITPRVPEEPSSSERSEEPNEDKSDPDPKD